MEGIKSVFMIMQAEGNTKFGFDITIIEKDLNILCKYKKLQETSQINKKNPVPTPGS